jgi:hypothetical protein
MECPKCTFGIGWLNIPIYTSSILVVLKFSTTSTLLVVLKFSTTKFSTLLQHCTHSCPGSQSDIFHDISWWIWRYFDKYPALQLLVESYYFVLLLLLRFSAELLEGKVTTAQVDTCTVY